MAGRKWTEAEAKWLIDRVKKGEHPKALIPKLKKKFGTVRSYHSIEKKLGTHGISFSHTMPTAPEQEFEPHHVTQAVKHDREVAKLNNEIKLLKVKQAEMIHRVNTQEYLLSVGEQLITALPKVKQPAPIPRQRGATEEHAFLLLSDIHYPETVSAAEMGGLNEYNRVIANCRLKYLVEGVRDIAVNKMLGYKLSTLHILCLGDWMSGNIHEELAETNDGDAITASMDLAFIVAQMVRDLLLVFPKIEMVGVVGNHGRMTKKKRFKRPYVNWDFVCYQFLSGFLAQEIAAKTVKVDFPESFWRMHDINGHNCLILHGDNINSWAGIPWYGIQRASYKMTEMFAARRIFYEYMFIGHFHNEASVQRPKGEIIINGSVMGGNEFSQGALFTMSAPVQLFGGAHPKRLSWRFPMDLSEPDVVGELYQTIDLSKVSLGDVLAERLRM